MGKSFRDRDGRAMPVARGNRAVVAVAQAAVWAAAQRDMAQMAETGAAIALGRRAVNVAPRAWVAGR